MSYVEKVVAWLKGLFFVRVDVGMTDDVPEEVIDPSKLTKKELLELASIYDVDVKAGWTKAKIIDVLQAANVV